MRPESLFWNQTELWRYLHMFREVDRNHQARIQLIRDRIRSGYYLTDEITRATAERMLRPCRVTRRPPNVDVTPT